VEGEETIRVQLQLGGLDGVLCLTGLLSQDHPDMHFRREHKTMHELDEGRAIQFVGKRIQGQMGFVVGTHDAAPLYEMSVTPV